MNARTSIKELATPRPKPDEGPSPAPPPEPDSDSFNEPSGDGRTSRHQILGLEVEDSAKDLWFFPYGCLMPCKLGKANGGTYTFRIASDESIFEMTIEGPISAARHAIDKLCSGKRELLRANEDTISAIRIREIKQEKKEPKGA